MDRRRLLILPYALWLLGLVAAPFSFLLAASFAERDELHLLRFHFSIDAYRALFDPLYLAVFARTFFMAALHSLLTIAAAYPVAFFLSRLPRRKAAAHLTILLIPFWTNYLVRLLAFMDVLRLEPFGLGWTFTFRGVIAALVYNYLPFAVLPLYSALEKVPSALIEAARDLGASKRQVFFRLLWPLTRKPVFAAFLLVFIPALGEFLIPELVGGGQNFFLGTFLEQQFLTFRHWPLGAAAVAFLIALSVVLLLLGGRALAEESA